MHEQLRPSQAQKNYLFFWSASFCSLKTFLLFLLLNQTGVIKPYHIHQNGQILFWDLQYLRFIRESQIWSLHVLFFFPPKETQRLSEIFVSFCHNEKKKSSVLCILQGDQEQYKDIRKELWQKSSVKPQRNRVEFIISNRPLSNFAKTKEQSRG